MRYFDQAEGISAQYWIEGTLEIMRRCDVVLVVLGKHTEKSEGTQGEIAEAKRLGLPIFRSLLNFSAWLEGTPGSPATHSFRVLR